MSSAQETALRLIERMIAMKGGIWGVVITIDEIPAPWKARA